MNKPMINTNEPTEDQKILVGAADRLQNYAETLFKKGDMFHPMIDAGVTHEGKQGRAGILVSDIMDQVPADKVPAVISQVLSEMSATDYVMGSEAWTVELNAKTTEELPDIKGIKPSTDDRRVSTLVLSGGDNKGNHILRIIKINEGKERSLGDVRVSDFWNDADEGRDGEYSGRLTGLLVE